MMHEPIKVTTPDGSVTITFTIPAEIASEIGIERGTEIAIDVDHRNRHLIVRKREPNDAS